MENDLITISINYDFLVSALLFCMVVFTIYLMVEMIFNEIRRSKESKCQPYYDHWKKLEGEEANKFYTKHKDKIQEISYY